MQRFLIAALLLATATPGLASSLTVSGLIDAEEGRSVDLDGRLSLNEAWDVGAGIGHGESAIDEQRFSGTGLRAFTDVQLGSFLLGASAERWKDSGQLRATVLRGDAGWMSDSGLALSGLIVDRELSITYTATLAGQTRDFEVKLQGTGFGAEIGWIGEQWSASARYVGYDYGSNVDRIRNLLDASSTDRFPRLQRLLQSMATRAAGAPDRELSLLLGRQFGGTSLSVDWQLQRDAVTRDKTWSSGLSAGFDLNRHWLLDTAVGVSDSPALDTVAWASVVITWLGADTP